MLTEQLGHKNNDNLDEKSITSLGLSQGIDEKIGQNIKFDFIVLHKRGIQMNSLEYTMLMSYVLDAGKNRYNMDTLSKIHLNHFNCLQRYVGSGKNKLILAM